MASRRTTIAPNSVKNAPVDPKSSKTGSSASKANNSGAGKKTGKSSGTVVKSRYMQAAEKSSLSKSNSLTNESIAVPPRPSSPKPSAVKPRVGTSPRRSMAPQSLATTTMLRESEPSLLGKSVLQSTFAEGPCVRPNFDMSIIKEKTMISGSAELEKNPENDKRLMEMQTFLLAYLTAKMESNTAKYKAEAEMSILQEIEEEEDLRKEVQEKKRQYLLMEKERLVNELLDLQIAALTPVAEAAKQFTSDYNTFARAVDTTRHELPVKNFYIGGDGKEFLEKAEAYLKESEKLLAECTDGDYEANSTSLECLKNIKMMSKELSQQLSGTCSDLLEMTSLVSRHTVQGQLATEEEQMGAARIQELFCPKQ